MLNINTKTKYEKYKNQKQYETQYETTKNNTKKQYEK